MIDICKYFKSLWNNIHLNYMLAMTSPCTHVFLWNPLFKSMGSTVISCWFIKVVYSDVLNFPNDWIFSSSFLYCCFTLNTLTLLMVVITYWISSFIVTECSSSSLLMLFAFKFLFSECSFCYINFYDFCFLSLH